MAFLLPETWAIIAEVELLSGRPVHVEVDASLSAHATVITARGSLLAHLVRYRSGAGPVDYLIVYQLGFLIRTFSMPPDRRFQVASTASKQKAAVRLLGLEVLEPEMAKWLVTNLIVQLRSSSVGMRVDDWIRRDPKADIGFDLSREYREALAIHRSKSRWLDRGVGMILIEFGRRRAVFLHRPENLGNLKPRRIAGPDRSTCGRHRALEARGGDFAPRPAGMA